MSEEFRENFSETLTKKNKFSLENGIKRLNFLIKPIGGLAITIGTLWIIAYYSILGVMPDFKGFDIIYLIIPILVIGLSFTSVLALIMFLPAYYIPYGISDRIKCWRFIVLIRILFLVLPYVFYKLLTSGLIPYFNHYATLVFLTIIGLSLTLYFLWEFIVVRKILNIKLKTNSIKAYVKMLSIKEIYSKLKEGICREENESEVIDFKKKTLYNSFFSVIQYFYSGLMFYQIYFILIKNTQSNEKIMAFALYMVFVFVIGVSYVYLCKNYKALLLSFVVIFVLFMAVIATYIDSSFVKNLINYPFKTFGMGGTEVILHFNKTNYDEYQNAFLAQDAKFLDDSEHTIKVFMFSNIGEEYIVTFTVDVDDKPGANDKTGTSKKYSCFHLITIKKNDVIYPEYVRKI